MAEAENDLSHHLHHQVLHVLPFSMMTLEQSANSPVTLRSRPVQCTIRLYFEVKSRHSPLSLLAVTIIKGSSFLYRT